jgi:hypothetical protein
VIFASYLLLNSRFEHHSSLRAEGEAIQWCSISVVPKNLRRALLNSSMVVRRRTWIASLRYEESA